MIQNQIIAKNFRFKKTKTLRDIADLEREESAEQRRTQSGQGLKILTPNQILSRLQISLAQLKSGNNSERLKNKIRQLFYILCIDKKN